MRLTRLQARNFRGLKEVDFMFTADGDTTIVGANGTGKSTVMNAFFWCLFGKDTAGRKDFNIQRLEGGTPIAKVDTAVTVSLELEEGGEVTLTRTYRDVWGKVRGSKEEVLKGHETLTEWNGVPMNVGEFNEKVEGIIPIERFKMLTNTEYFLTMKWDVMRRELVGLAFGDKEEPNIGAEECEELTNALIGKTTEELKKELNARKRKAKAELETVAPRVDQTEKLKPEAQDWETLEADLEGSTARLLTIENALKSEAGRLEALGERYNGLNRGLYVKRKELADYQAIRREEVQKEGQAKLEEAEKYKREAMQAVSRARRIDEEAKELDEERRSIYAKSFKIEAKMKELREEYKRINGEVWEGQMYCNYCHQALPENMVEEARGEWNATKAQRLNQINEEGVRLSEEKKEVAESLDKLQEKREALETKRQDIFKELHKAQGLGDEADEKGKELLRLCDDLEPDERETALMIEVEELEKRVAEERAGVDESEEQKELKAQKKELESHIFEVRVRLRDRKKIEDYDREVEELNKRGDALVQELANVEKLENQLTEYNKRKVEALTGRINSLFSVVTFKLYDETLQGEYVETCIPLVKGVPYSTANTAGRLNAGLDVINTLSREYGMTAPIFIDNRESVTDIIPVKSQVINLKVSTDKKLSVQKWERN